MNYGLHCVGCPLAQNDTLEGAARLHHLDLEKLLEDLNKAAERSAEKQ
jgi:hybrid cluster-associated redox disulfide protein